MCCGTHVSNLADIQCVKLLYTESKRGSTLLYYMAGDRVTQYLTRSLDVERNLNKLLRCGYHISLTLFCYQRLPTHTLFSPSELFVPPACLPPLFLNSFLHTVTTICLLFISVGQDEHCAAVDRVLKSGKQMAKVVFTCVCMCVCM